MRQLVLVLLLAACDNSTPGTVDQRGAADAAVDAAVPDLARRDASKGERLADARRRETSADLGRCGTLTECGGQCVDLQNDPKNCSVCGGLCSDAPGIICKQAQCVCSVGLCCDIGKSECGGACVDLQVDPSHCGTCDKVCAVASGSTCVKGNCTVCGDGVAAGNEQCDKGDLNGRTCLQVGFNGGKLACKLDCSYDLSGCTCQHPAVTKSCSGGWCTIPAGCFTMGSPTTEPCRDTNETQHQVTLTHGFEVGEAEVTEAEFVALLGYPSFGSKSCTTCPATPWWYGGAAYCNALSKSKGLTPCYYCPGGESSPGSNCQTKATYACAGYRLPTEAEWEYAYRAGTISAYYNGPNDAAQCTGTDAGADGIGWYDKNSGGTAHPGKSKLPNGWGLYDMAGNAWEWTQDSYQADLGTSPVSDPLGVGSSGVVRGGAFYKEAAVMRAAARLWWGAGMSSSWVGFRCVRTLNP